jgi:hypothetical protein
MTTPASAIKDKVHQLIDFQIQTFTQPGPLTSSQLDDHHYRSKKIRTLYEELDRIGSRSVVERRLERASFAESAEDGTVHWRSSAERCRFQTRAPSAS